MTIKQSNMQLSHSSMHTLADMPYTYNQNMYTARPQSFDELIKKQAWE
jgi:hypothetical protein